MCRIPESGIDESLAEIEEKETEESKEEEKKEVVTA